MEIVQIFFFLLAISLIHNFCEYFLEDAWNCYCKERFFPCYLGFIWWLPFNFKKVVNPYN